MKLIAKVLVVTLLVQLSAPPPCLAQQTAEGNIGKLREQIAKLEKIDLDPETSPEIKSLNREFLEERRARLNDLVGRRVTALRQYLAAAGDALSPRERQAVENSIRALAQEAGGAAPVAAPNPVSVANAAANTSAGAKFNVGEAVYRGSLLPPAAEAVSAPQGEAAAGRAGGTEDAVGVLQINMNPPPRAIPTPLEVKNDTSVTVTGSKKFVDTCKVDTKREELKPEPNPLGQILKVLVGLGPIALGKIDAKTCPAAPAADQIPDDPEARRVEADLLALRRTLSRSVTAVNDVSSRYGLVADQISAFAGCKRVQFDDRGNPIRKVTDADRSNDEEYDLADICGDADTFIRARNALKPNVEAAVNLSFPDESVEGGVLRPDFVIESAEVQMEALKKAITDGYKKKGREIAQDADPEVRARRQEEFDRRAKVEEDWIQSVNARLNCHAGTLEAVRREVASLQTSRAEFETFLKLVDRQEELTPAQLGSYSKALIVDANAKVTGTVTCTNFFTKQPSGDPIPFTVTYQRFSPHSLSAGILFSTLGKRQLGIQPVRVGTTEDGSATFRLMFTETDRADGQLIPFTFYNYRFFGGRKFSLNGTGGVGVNPNNGAAQVEFFAGGAVGVQNVFVQMGAHVGRWQELGGGLILGDLVPSGVGPPPVPIERRYTVRPGVGISFKMPLP
jgi:hypothetical protein